MATHAQRLERIARLVSEPSVSSAVPELDHSNMRVIHGLAELLEDAGFAVEVLPLPGNPNKANLLASLGRGSGGLVLAGHTDTVPYDQALWQSDPFKLAERDGKLYGLGAADMKGFLALAVEAPPHVGGQALSEQFEGYTFDVTGHWLHLRDPDMRALASAILLFIINLIGLGLGPWFVGMISDALKPAYGS